jgi:cation:H+ antiporter
VGVVFLLDKKNHASRITQEFSGKRLAHDQAWFMGVFICKVALGMVVFAYKPWLAVLFLLTYAVYVWKELRADDSSGDKDEDKEPLKLRKRDADPPAVWAVAQTLGALVAIFLSSQLFVRQLETVGPWLGMSPQLVALLLSPIATELPETVNAIIWVRQGKTSLALGNISGAMMIQATVPSALGIMFTPWLLDKPLIWAAVVTILAIVAMFLLLKLRKLTAKRLAMFGGLYALFAVGAVRILTS